MEKIAAVIVTHNRIKLLRCCLERLEKQIYPCDILVVNNASTDGTQEWLYNYMQHNNNVQEHTIPNNIGGAGGFNYGIRWAVEAGYDYVWVMDDDCLPEIDALEKIMEADCILGGPQNYGFLSSVVLWTDGHECVMNRQKISKQFYQYVEYLNHGIVLIQQATFVSLFLPARVIQQVGLPIKDYFIWGDDIEYTRRIALHEGMKCFLVGQSRVIHAMDKNGGSDIATDAVERIERYELAYRNESYTYRQQGPAGVICYILRCIKAIFRIFCYAQDCRGKRLGAVLRGVLKGTVFNPKVEYIQEKVKEN